MEIEARTSGTYGTSISQHSISSGSKDLFCSIPSWPGSQAPWYLKLPGAAEQEAYMCLPHAALISPGEVRCPGVLRGGTHQVCSKPWGLPLSKQRQHALCARLPPPRNRAEQGSQSLPASHFRVRKWSRNHFNRGKLEPVPEAVSCSPWEPCRVLFSEGLWWQPRRCGSPWDPWARPSQELTLVWIEQRVRKHKWGGFCFHEILWLEISLHFVSI